MKRLIAAVLAVFMLATPVLASVTSITINNVTVLGNWRMVVATIVLAHNYTTGGESLTAAMLGLSTVVYLQASSDMLGTVWEYDYSAATLAAYATGDTLSTALNQLSSNVDYQTAA